MSKSLIQLYNESTQAVTENNVINLGSVLRRYGCNLRLSGGAVEIDGPGYYEANVIATVEPTAVGNVTVALFENNVQIPGATASAYAASAASPVVLPIVTTIRKGCNCDGASQIVLKLIEGPGNVTNVSTKIVKS